MNIIHLDLKPGNIFIHEGKLKIGDFGLATFCPVTSSSEKEGDRTYIAPEVLGSHYDTPADIFRYASFLSRNPSIITISLGLVILEIAANIVLPEFGDSWVKLRNNDFSEIDLRSTSPALVDIIKLLLKKEPGDRPTAKQILENSYLNQVMTNGLPPRRLDLEGDSFMT